MFLIFFFLDSKNFILKSTIAYWDMFYVRGTKRLCIVFNVLRTYLFSRYWSFCQAFVVVIKEFALCKTITQLLQLLWTGLQANLCMKAI